MSNSYAVKIASSHLGRIILPGLVLFLLVTGCSQYSDKSMSVGYHNLTARYNAYFLANNKLTEAEFKIQQAYKEDYAAMMPLILPWDSVRAMPVKTELEDVIKKSSIVAERHQNSKWLDNSYILLGRARLHLGQWDHGTEALRYVVSNGTSEEDKNEALIWLMRAYVERQDYTNALNVAEYLRQQPLSEALTKQYYLTKAFLHQQKEEYLLAVAILDQLLPMVPKSPEKARLYYVAGQLYDKLGQYKLANDHYAQVAKNQPLYDLAFYAEMNGLQNKVLLDPNLDITAIGFGRMVKDRKNQDLQDRLYFTMGLLEEGKGNYKEALSLLSKAVAAGRSNTTQVPHTYLQLARIHYDKLDDYGTAKLYYDSALISLPKNLPLYKEINERKGALDTFVKHFETVRLEDSLQVLAALSPEVLSQRIDKIIEKEVADKKKQEEEERKLLAQQQAMAAAATPATSVTGAQRQRWELYDPTKASAGKSAFKRTWGNRTLEDDWRRSQKDLRINTSIAVNSADSTNTGASTEQQDEMKPGSTQWVARHTALLATVPKTEEALASSHQRKENALFELGKIYYLSLAEPKKALTTFDRLLMEYATTKYREEVYYLSYLAAEESAKMAWKDRLVAEYPGSTYVSLLGEGGIVSVDKIASLYDQAFSLYMKEDYEQGLKEVESMMPKVRQTQQEPKFALLRIFLIGKVRGEAAYKAAIEEFLKLYPTSEYANRVKEMADMPRFR